MSRPLAVVLAACFLGSAACAGRVPVEEVINVNPDLTPVSLSGGNAPTDYCVLRPDGALRLRIANPGSASATTDVKVEFSHAAPRHVSGLSIAAGSFSNTSVDVPTPIPAGDFSFTITVDANEVVPELNESNNTVQGRCIT